MTRTLFAVGLFATVAAAQPPMPPEQQAEVLLTAGRKAYADGNLPFAAERFQEVVTKFPNTPQVQHARYGLALCLVANPAPDFAKVIDALTHPAADGAFAERGAALSELAAAHRALGLQEAKKAATVPAEAAVRTKAAADRFTKAKEASVAARDWFTTKADLERAARARCDEAEMELRLNRPKEAKAAADAVLKSADLSKTKAKSLALYYHGLASFLDRDYRAAGRSLNQLAPFADPVYGPHARYLVGRVLHLGGENAEAASYYDAVLADFEKHKKDAAEALKQPDKFKTNPREKARLEALVKDPPPEYVSAAAFHSASLNYESGKFGEALPKFQAFGKEYAASPLQPDALLRAGCCLVQTKNADEAVKVLTPLETGTPRLADQAMFWIGKAHLVAAAGTPADKPADRDARTKLGLDWLKKAVAKVGEQVQQNQPDAKVRQAEVLFELADALQAAKLPKEAVPLYERLWNDGTALPLRRDELLQRLGAALGAAGSYDASDARCAEFLKTFDQSPLTAAVRYREAENAYARALAAAPARKPGVESEAVKFFTDAALKYKEVAKKFPEFDRANAARLGLAVCEAQLGRLEETVTALEAIPPPDRSGELAPAAYLLADCLIRLAPAKAEDALQENQLREKLTAAAGLLEGFAAGSPKSPDAPAALLKLGFCQKRLGSTLADPGERNKALDLARQTYDKLIKDYPQDPAAAHAVLERANVRALVGDRGGAMNELRRFQADAFLKQSPVAALAAIRLSALLREENKSAEAAALLAAARAQYDATLLKDPERAEWVPLLKFHHAVAESETDKAAESVAKFEAVVAESGDRPLAADAALRAGQVRIAEAEKFLKAAADLRAANKDSPKLAELTTKGRTGIYDAMGFLATSAGRLRRANPTSDAPPRMLYDAAWAARRLADIDLAAARDLLQRKLTREALEAAVAKLPPKSPPPVIAPVEIPKGAIDPVNYEKRVYELYGKLIEDSPDLALAVDARFELADLLAERDQHEEAVKLLKAALDAEPTDKPVPAETLDRIRLRLGASLAALKDYPGAAAQFDAVAGNLKSPHYAQALYRAGEALYAAGEFAKAAEKLAVFRDKGELQNVPGVSDRAMLRLGQSLAADKKWEPARVAFEAGLNRFGAGNPFAAHARYGLGWAQQNLQQHEAAVGTYQQVIAATKSDLAARAQLGIGECRLAQKRYAEAAAECQKAAYGYAYPEVGYAALLEAARALALDNKPADAEKLLQKVVADAPKDSEWAKAAQERLNKMKP